ncbi:leptin-like [Genypterus blacodes]|uniref:leptin-like n=1 Tax=Genypterus blacodes TaxID=154954 RepID=UPI003F759D88
MEPNRGTHSQISRGIPGLFGIMHIQRYSTNMVNILVLAMFSLLQIISLSTAAPLSGDTVIMRSKVKRAAEQLVWKIDTYLQVPAGVTISPPADDLGGLSSIVAVLEGYESLISDSLEGLSQVKQEVSSLAGYLKNWRLRHCSELLSKPPVQGRLTQLQSQKEFIHTVSREALSGLNEFLKQLLKKLDNLETC